MSASQLLPLDLYLLIPASFLLVLAGTGMVRRYALRRGMVDRPNTRSSHVMATPRGGGAPVVAVFLGALLALFLSGRIPPPFLLALGGGAALTGGIGFLDDHWSIPAGVRFAIHLLAGILLAGALLAADPGNMDAFGVFGKVLFSGGVVLFAAWFINLYNFMDGIDGLAAAEAIFVSLAGGTALYIDGLCAPALLCWIMASASAGFMAWNWHPARIFMGDVCSGFLGFAFVAIALSPWFYPPPEGALLHQPVWGIPLSAWAFTALLSLFFADSTVTLLRRILRREAWWRPHRTHAYQHMVRRLGHGRTTLAACGVNLLLPLPAAWFCIQRPRLAPALLAASLLLLSMLAIRLRAGRPEEITQPAPA